MQLTTQYSGWNEKELGFFSSIPHSWESRTCTHVLWPSPAGKTTNQEGLFWHWAVPLWRIYDLGKVKPFLPSPFVQWSLFFPPMVCWKPRPPQRFSYPWIDCLQQCPLGAPKLQLKRGWSGFMVTAGSTARTEVRVPIVRGAGKWVFSQAPREMVLHPTAPTMASFMDGCQAVAVKGEIQLSNALLGLVADVTSSLCWFLKHDPSRGSFEHSSRCKKICVGIFCPQFPSKFT